ncbi:MAG: UvrD-helicase domain-containing protein [Rhodocyclaceae bacterium]|nr:UvrD-helicase domain-containing protein [Rhodocyclaceae bacterium]
MSDDSLAFIRRALDPARSVVVEACAGSGKTWLLVSRILRLLLAGARPGEILAITYTRKAAREIQARLQEWLRELALAPDEKVQDFLRERGMIDEETRRYLPQARGLLERVEAASPAITVTTFHGWFGRILQGAAFDSGLAGYTLSEAEAPMRDEAWARLARRCGAEPAGPLARALVELLEHIGQSNARKLLDAFVARRAEWQAWLAAGGESVATTLALLAEELGVRGSPGDVMAAVLGQAGLREDLLEYAALLGRNTATDQGLAKQIAAALVEGTAAELAYGDLRGAILTAEGAPRQRKASPTQAKRLGGAGQDRLLALHAELAEVFQDAEEALLAARILAFNRLGLTVGAALLEEYEDHKRQRRLMDYSDLEWHADRLLADETRGPFIQARLDARYRHILLDEFQDTNPLQWRILMAWLAAYGADAQRPGIFLVGDPKQAIYRFRRADSRIFLHAREALRADLAADVLHNDATFRNAPVVVQVVNTLFEAEGEGFQGFRCQTARRCGLPGRVELLPLIAASPGDEPAPAGLRNPLATPLPLAEDLRRRQEAQGLVARLAEMIGQWRVGEGAEARPARWGDVLILTRRRAVLPEFERALREAGVPYLSVSRGGLLQTLEARDLMALLGFLVTPGDDLALAHVLRTPLFALADDELLTLAGAGKGAWWQGLQTLAAAGTGFAQRPAALLGAWRLAAPHLPVHDLLDRIYHQGDLVSRYRERVPAPMWPGVRANLEAFIGLALELDGGRFPSLSRFVDELARLDGAGDEEAPDEGVLAAGEGGEDRLRLMTIHGAKGLEAPIVALVDAHNTHRMADGYQPVLDWPPGEAAPRHFSLYATAKERGRAREALFAQEEAARAREDLNLLYVAITRARQVFLASGIEPAKGGGSGSFYARILGAVRALGGELAHGEMPLAGLAERPILFPVTPPLAVAPPPPIPVGERRAPVDETPEIRFGIQLHALLEARTGGATRRDLGDLEPGVEAMAESILAAPRLRCFFAPEGIREARNEIEFIDAEGAFGRIDRLVRLEDGVWILDYKSGRPGHGEVERYRPQLERYRAVIQAIYPDDRVRCALIFGDASLVEL